LLGKVSSYSILGDLGADSQCKRQIKWAKLVQAEAWYEGKFTRWAGTAPGRKQTSSRAY